jgi:hypothetical protein
MKNVKEQKLQEEEKNDPVITDDQEVETPKRKSISRRFNVRLGEADLLAHAMSVNQESLTPRGADEAFVTKLTEIVTDVGDLNKEQEKHKALQKEATAKLNEKLNEMDQMVSDARNYVKMTMPQERWVEFGIRATR